MNVQIRDADALESITTSSLRRYLQSSGWSYGGCWGTWATIHVKEHRGRMREVLTPLRDDASDYAEFMAEALSALSEVEERSQPDIFRDLQREEPEPSEKRKGNNTMKWTEVKHKDYSSWKSKTEKRTYIIGPVENLSFFIRTERRVIGYARSVLEAMKMAEEFEAEYDSFIEQEENAG